MQGGSTYGSTYVFSNLDLSQNRQLKKVACYHAILLQDSTTHL